MASVEPGHQNLAPDHRFGDDQRLAEEVIEALGEIASDLEVLLLIATDRDHVRVVQDDVGRHQHGVIEDTGVRGLALGERIFIGRPAFELTGRDQAAEDPGELVHLDHRGLPEEHRMLRVEPRREPGGGDVVDVLLERAGSWTLLKAW